MYNASLKNGIVDGGKHKKIASTQKWKNKVYYVQNNEYVDHQDVKIYCNNNQFTELKCCIPHNKPHGARGLGKNYHLQFYTKLGHGTCEICCNTCACTK